MSDKTSKRDAPADQYQILSVLFKRYSELAQKNSALLDVLAPKCRSTSLVALCAEAIANGKDYPFDKMNRWLGFTQGVLAVVGVIDVDTEREFTRPLLHRLHVQPVKSWPTDSATIQPTAATSQPSPARSDKGSERVMFEDWMGKCDFQTFADGAYVDDAVNKSWGGWQERARRATAPGTKPPIPTGISSYRALDGSTQSSYRATASNAATAAPGECAQAVAPADAVRDAERWISVADRLPEPDQRVLVLWNGLVMTDEYEMQSEQPAGPTVGGWMDTGYDFNYNDEGKVTHWMPLPAAPTTTPKEPAK